MLQQLLMEKVYQSYLDAAETSVEQDVQKRYRSVFVQVLQAKLQSLGQTTSSQSVSVLFSTICSIAIPNSQDLSFQPAAHPLFTTASSTASTASTASSSSARRGGKSRSRRKQARPKKRARSNDKASTPDVKQRVSKRLRGLAPSPV